MKIICRNPIWVKRGSQTGGWFLSGWLSGSYSICESSTHKDQKVSSNGKSFYSFDSVHKVFLISNPLAYNYISKFN
jgi:hypothetical protein